MHALRQNFQRAQNAVLVFLFAEPRDLHQQKFCIFGNDFFTLSRHRIDESFEVYSVFNRSNPSRSVQICEKRICCFLRNPNNRIVAGVNSPIRKTEHTNFTTSISRVVFRCNEPCERKGNFCSNRSPILCGEKMGMNHVIFSNEREHSKNIQRRVNIICFPEINDTNSCIFENFAESAVPSA